MNPKFGVSSDDYLILSIVLISNYTFSATRARIHRHVASSGNFVVSTHYIGFWSKLFTKADVRYRVPIPIIKAVKASGCRFLHHGISLEIEGQEDLEFDFKGPKPRDDAVRLISAAIDRENSSTLKSLPSPGSAPPTPGVSETSSSVYTPHTPTRSATSILAPLSRTLVKANTMVDIDGIRKIFPKVINIPQDNLWAQPSRHFICLTIGSRGDVQPYIALALGLKKEGHRVTIVTHEEYKEWVQGFGVEHRTAGGDPGALMKLSVEHKVGRSYLSFRRESYRYIKIDVLA